MRNFSLFFSIGNRYPVFEFGARKGQRSKASQVDVKPKKWRELRNKFTKSKQAQQKRRKKKKWTLKQTLFAVNYVAPHSMV